MATTPPNQPPFDPQAPRDPNAPFDPTNVNDPRYDAARDPRFDPRWQQAQQRFYRDQQRAAQRAQAAAWKAQTRASRDQWKMYRYGQRRSSLVGPILLITVGVIFFLIHIGRISAMGFFNWYGHWWPVLLIGIGVLRLAEWAVDRARHPEGASPIRYSLGGGAITIIVILALLGLATHTMQWRADQNGLQFFGFRGGDDMGHLFGQKHEEDVPQVVHDIAANATLAIDSPHGDVTISGTSDDGKLHLNVHKEVYTNSDSEAADRLRQLTPVIEGASDSLTVRIPTVQGGGADLTLLVPASVRVTLNANRGDVHATNLKSPLVVTANNGDVEVAAITGDVHVHANNRRRDVNVRSVAGSVTVDGTGEEVTITDVSGAAAVRGDFMNGGRIQHVTGAVEYHSSRTDLSFAHLNGDLQLDGQDLNANEVMGPILVSTRSRNITLDRVTGDVKVVNNHGDVDLHMAPPAGAITVDNQNGNVNLTLPDKAKFTVQAETSDGDTHSDFAGVNSGEHGALTGSANGGGALIKVNTSHGDVSVTRNSVPPLPAAPAKPRITGFGSVGPGAIEPPAPPTPPDISGAIEAGQDAREQARQALEQAKQAVRDAQEKQREAEQKAREATRDAEQKAREATLHSQEQQREAEQKAREATLHSQQQQREAEQNAREVIRQAQEKQREAEQRTRDAARPN